MLPRTYIDQSGSPEDLVNKHMTLVRRIAWHIHGRVGQRAEIEELLQIAHFALVEASRRYAPQPGVPFASYAAIRIRGALMDHLRSMAGQGRGTLRQQKQLAAAERELAQQLMRTPTEAELAEHLGLDPNELASWRMDGAAATESLDTLYTDQSTVFSDPSPGAEELLERKAMRLLLRDAVARLPEREALVLQLYFVEELNIYEVAEVLKVTTGRVSQIKKAAIERLRADISSAQSLPQTQPRISHAAQRAT